MTPRSRPAPDELARLYAEAPRAGAVAALLGCSRATALAWLRQAGVSLRPRGPHLQPARHPWKRDNDRP